MSGTTRSAALDILSGFQPGNDVRAVESVARTRALLENGVAPFARNHFDPGHVTASAVVLSVDERVLLVHHPRLARWLQPGGHVEPGDASLVAAARREVAEETGLELPATPEAPLVRVDVHRIPAERGEPAHWHHDFMFGFRLAGPALDHAGNRQGDHRVAWAPTSALETYGLDTTLRCGVEGAVRLLST